MLDDKDTYSKLSGNTDLSVLNKIKKLCSQYKQNLTKKEITYLTNFDYKTSNFYGLPKIHKSDLIKNEICGLSNNIVNLENPTDLVLRPIVAGPACPTHRLSHILDILLQPFIKLVDSYVRDSTDLLNKLPSKLSCSETFITFDVVSLYSNIKHDLGYEALRYWLNYYPTCLNDRFPAEFVIAGCKLILENNTFQFHSMHYKQILGTAMGTKFAPAYATLVLGYLETKLFSRLSKKLTTHVTTIVQAKYFRYLDDIFCIWDHKYGNFAILEEELQGLDDRLTFKQDQYGDEVTFLDLKIIKSNNAVHTDIFYKPTDSHQYLDFYSNHPRHVKSNVPYNLARRICTIVSVREWRDFRLTELAGYLKECNYPDFLIKNGITKALQLPINELRQPRQTPINENKNIFYISTYNPNYEDHSDITRQTFNFLKMCPQTKHIYKDCELTKSKRQPPNLKKLLTSAQPHKSSFSVTRCNTKQCQICDSLIEGSTFEFSEFVFKINENMNCNSRNCVYVMRCEGCKKLYIGETSNFRSRVNLHKSHIKNKGGLFVNKHISQCNDNISKDIKYVFKIMPFFKVKQDDEKIRKEKESYFISKFKPELNKDLPT